MRLLLDTHVFLWWLGDDRRLTPALRKKIAASEAEVLVSAASIWEMAVKIAVGKLTLTGVDSARLDELISVSGFRELAVSARHATAVGSLPLHHHDPFDRLLIAQARAENATLVSVDATFVRYDVRLLTR